MPTFMAPNASFLADTIIPLTLADAVTLTDWCVKREINGNPGDGRGYFAVYGPDMDGKPGKWALHVSPEFLQGKWCYYVHMTEYHPRKDGKADIEFGKPARKPATR